MYLFNLFFFFFGPEMKFVLSERSEQLQTSLQKSKRAVYADV